MTKKKNRLSGAAFQAAKSMATTVTGYDEKSPIWGLRLPEVLDIVEGHINTGDYGDALTVITELKKRLAKNAVIAQARG